MEQWTALVHSRKSLSTAPLLECSNALKMKGPGGPGPFIFWWAVLGSNQWPLPCEDSALPAELTAQTL